MLLLMQCDGNGFALPAGWNEIGSEATHGSSRSRIAWRVANNEPASYTITTNSGNERGIAFIVTYRDVANAGPIDNFSINNQASNQASPANFAAMTPTQDDCMVVAFLATESGNNGNSFVTSWPANFIEAADNTNGPPGTGSGSAGGAFAEWNQTTAAQASGNAAHSTGSTAYAAYFISLVFEVPVIGIDDQGDEQLDAGDVNELIDGFGFGAVQGTGKVEIGDSADYGTATLVEQTVTAWADDQITYDLVSTGFTNGAKFVFVTNDKGDRTSGYQVNFGRLPYGEILQALDFDIIHSFDGNFDDTGARAGGYAANGQVDTAPNSFKSEAGIPGGNTQCWGPDSVTAKIEMADTPWTNVTNTHQRREIMGWIQLPATPYKRATVLWEEGGGVNNHYFALGPGNALFFNVADSNGSPAFKAQAFADFPLTPLRWYHIHGIMECGVGIQGVQLNIDGLAAQVTAGDLPITDTTFSTHSGDYTYGGGDGSLDTGDVDITYASSDGTKFAWWATMSNSGGGAPLTADERRQQCFALSCPFELDLGSDTEANMQVAIDAEAPVAYSNVPGAIRISRPAGGGDLRIELNDVTFDSAVSLQVYWDGNAGETLTLVNNGTSNVDANMCIATFGGPIVVENPATLTVAGLIAGAEIRIYDDDVGGSNLGTELAGIETLAGTTFQYSHSGAANTIIVQMIADGFEEVLETFQLAAQDQTLTVNPIVETNV
ncbi:MAG: hypothetical protein AAF358_13675 [Pseudomonadota bacterium]